MKVQIVSADSSLLSLAKEIACEFPERDWAISLVSSLNVDLNTDLGLWDFQPGLRLPQKAGWGTKHFALVEARDLESFFASFPYAEPSIVLKPVLHGVLRALISFAASHQGNARAAEANSALRSDRDDILQCLMKANLCLQQHDQQRTNFMSRAVHDFQAPLTAIGGYCSLLLQGELGPLDEQQKTVLNRMLSSATRLSRMTRSMLELSVGQRVDWKPAFTHGDLGDCLDQALHEVSPFLQEKQIQVDIEIEPGKFEFLFDSQQMVQLLVNLLENASKFTPRLGFISVRAYPCFFERRSHSANFSAQSERRKTHIEQPNSYRVDVRDSGPGIAPTHMKSIFDDYVSYGDHGASGSGLGLAVCKMIMQRHKGKIWVENGSPGAMFSCVFPLRPPDNTQAPQMQVQASQG